VRLTGGSGLGCVWWWWWRWWWGGGGFGRLKSALGLIDGAATGGEISVVAMHLRARAELDAELAALLGAARDRRVRAVSTPWLRRGGRAECNGAHGGGRWT
jgi:hypothetical protein